MIGIHGKDTRSAQARSKPRSASSVCAQARVRSACTRTRSARALHAPKPALAAPHPRTSLIVVPLAAGHVFLQVTRVEAAHRIRNCQTRYAHISKDRNPHIRDA